MKKLFLLILTATVCAQDPNNPAFDAIAGAGDATCYLTIDFDTDTAADDVEIAYNFDSSTPFTGRDLIDALIAERIIECDYTVSEWGAYVTRFAAFGQDFEAIWGTDAQQWWAYYNSTDGINYSSSWSGADMRRIYDGDYDKWVFTVEDTSDFALWVTDKSAGFDSSTYKTPTNAIGKPTLSFYDTWNQRYDLTKVVEAPHGENSLVTIDTGQYLVVKFDHKVIDDPANLYGKDFIVFGNAFYVASGSSSDSADMSAVTTTGMFFAEQITVSVSQDGVNWYSYDSGPFADGEFPTQSYDWSDSLYAQTGNGWTSIEKDFTQPVNPEIKDTLLTGASVKVSDIIAAYGNSGGGTAFDLAETGLPWIKYIRFEGTGGEIDAVADVTHCGDEQHPAPAGDTNGDCRVDLEDFANITASWLECTWGCER
ncbi:MAG: hypothetical protein AB7F23_09430 [Phycisphaerae bacterium]